MDFVPATRQRLHSATFDLGELRVMGVSARGRRLAPKPVARMKKLRKGEARQEVDDGGADDPEPSAPDAAQIGLFGDEE